MTRKKAEKIVRGITDKIECNTADIDDWAGFWGFTREEYEEFLDTAIKASEQLNAFDKIRAEIEILDDADYDYEGYYKAVTDALQIIDKYRKEQSNA